MESPTRIFFDCHSFDAGWQGTTTYLAGILNALPKAAAKISPDLDLRIVCAAQHEDAIRRHVDAEFDFVPIRSDFVRRNIVDIPRALRRTGADLVVSQYVRPFFSPCPTMSVIHDVLFLDYPESFSWPYRTIRRLMFSWSARRSSVVSTVSRYSAERIAAHFGVDGSQILIIPNGVDPAFVGAKQEPPSPSNRVPLRLLSVSRLERRKRHEWCIAAMDALAADGIDSELTIVGGGNGAYATELHEMVNEARTRREHKITLKSGLSFADLIVEYAKTDLFLFTSEAEGFGIPVIEAAAVGKPCVCSTGGALAELDGQFSGISFPAGDMPAFLTAVRLIAKNIDAYRDEAKRKRQTVTETFNWKVAAEKYVDIVKRLLGEGK